MIIVAKKRIICEKKLISTWPEDYLLNKLGYKNTNSIIQLWMSDYVVC